MTRGEPYSFKSSRLTPSVRSELAQPEANHDDCSDDPDPQPHVENAPDPSTILHRSKFNSHARSLNECWVCQRTHYHVEPVAYFKVLLIALVGALAGALLWIVVGFVLPLIVPMLLGRLLNRGGIGAASMGSGSILLAALLGLIIAGTWAFRRFLLGL